MTHDPPLRLMVLNNQPTAQPYITRQAFAQLYEAVHRDVFRYVFGLTSGRQQDAEDITAETFLKAWDARHTFSGDETSALAWLMTIAKRLVIDRARRSMNRQTIIDVEPLQLSTTSDSPEDHLIQMEQQRKLLALLKTLPEDHCEMITLRYLVGWQIQEIAVYLGKKPNTVSVTIQRILSNLQGQWHIQEIRKFA